MLVAAKCAHNFQCLSWINCLMATMKSQNGAHVSIFRWDQNFKITNYSETNRSENKMSTEITHLGKNMKYILIIKNNYPFFPVHILPVFLYLHSNTVIIYTTANQSEVKSESKMFEFLFLSLDFIMGIRNILPNDWHTEKWRVADKSWAHKKLKSSVWCVHLIV